MRCLITMAWANTLTCEREMCGDSYFCISMLVDSIGLLMPMRYVCNALLLMLEFE